MLFPSSSLSLSLIPVITAILICSSDGFNPSQYWATITPIKHNKFERFRFRLGASTVQTVNKGKNQSLLTEIVRVSIPALAVCIIDPCLTLIDMFFVGGNSFA